jgi:hypothetical protein
MYALRDAFATPHRATERSRVNGMDRCVCAAEPRDGSGRGQMSCNVNRRVVGHGDRCEWEGAPEGAQRVEEALRASIATEGNHSSPGKYSRCRRLRLQRRPQQRHRCRQRELGAKP